MKDLTFEKVIQECNGYEKNLLLGNGFSRACDSRFAYDSLFQFSKLSKKIKNVFDDFNIKDFELVMNKFREVTDYCYSILKLLLIYYGIINGLSEMT